MKNIFKSLMIVVLFVGLGSSAFAQPVVTANTSMTASATILSDLAIAANVDLTFGQVINSTTPTMEANSATKTDVGGTATLGKFTVTGLAGASVHVSFTSTNLIHASEAFLVYTPSVYRTHLTAATFGSEPVTFAGADYVVNNVATAAESGVDHFFVGGSIVIGAEAPVGSYTGTITMTVAYN